MPDEKKFSALLQSASLNAKVQDGKILVYSLKGGDIHQGLLFGDEKNALAGLLPYVQFLRNNPYATVVDWAHKTQAGIPVVNNTSDPRSMYYDYSEAKTAEAYIKLLRVASELDSRVRTASLLNKVPGPNSSDKNTQISQLLADQRNSLEAG